MSEAEGAVVGAHASLQCVSFGAGRSLVPRFMTTAAASKAEKFHCRYLLAQSRYNHKTVRMLGVLAAAAPGAEGVRVELRHTPALIAESYPAPSRVHAISVKSAE